MKAKLLVLLVLSLGIFTTAHAETAKEIKFVQKIRKNSETDNVLSKELYVEHAVSKDEKISVFGVMYDDPDFNSAYMGVSFYTLEWLQFGVGAGVARYEDKTHAALNPWVYIEKGNLEVSLSYERYLDEKWYPEYYEGYLHYQINNSPVFIGLRTEKWVGTGPLIGLGTDRYRVWVHTPTHNKPEEGEMKVVLGLSIFF